FMPADVAEPRRADNAFLAAGRVSVAAGKAPPCGGFGWGKPGPTERGTRRSEPIDFHVATDRLNGGYLRCLWLFDRARLAGGDDLPGQRLDGAGQLLGQLLQQLALGADLVGGVAL